MAGPHDVGGRKGYGRIRIAPDEPQFKAGWEARVVGLAITTMVRGIVQVDRWRARQEELHPLAYLTMPYFQRWLYSIERNLVHEGILDADQIEARFRLFAESPDAALPALDDPAFVRQIDDLLANGGTRDVTVPDPPRFAVGERVSLGPARAERPGRSHTRLPAYAQGQVGTITRILPVQVLPDAMVSRNEENLEHVYAVRLEADQLWPDADEKASVSIDAWESYLAPADED